MFFKEIIMVIIDAEIYMYRLEYLRREFYVGGFMASIQIDGTPHMCSWSSILSHYACLPSLRYNSVNT